MSTLIIRMRVQPEKEERFLEIIHSIVGSMKGNEPDARVYAFWRTQTAHEYLLVESHLDQAALEFHIGRHIEFQKEFGTLLSEPPQVEELGEFVVGGPDGRPLPFA